MRDLGIWREIGHFGDDYHMNKQRTKGLWRHGKERLVIHCRTIRKSLEQHRGKVHIKDVTIKGYMGSDHL